ncbi:MAG: PhnA-like protein [Gemmatimonadaceae bacterium]|nr:PhnA-like protein [Acetobacteraceae bacterium]
MSVSMHDDLDAVVPDDRRTQMLNRVSWGAILAGVVTALVIQLVLNILGLGVGASSVNAAETGANPSAGGFSTTAGIWWTVSGILASLMGGVVAGRLCGAATTNTARWHGFVSWCTTTLVVFYLVTSAVGGIIGGVFGAFGDTIGAAGRGAAAAVSGVASSTDGDALAARVRQVVNPNEAQSVQDNVLAYMQASVAGDTAAANASRDRAIDSVARSANISPEEARTRIDQVEQQTKQTAETAKQKAAEAAEATRKGLATAGIFGFVALALGALAAWFGGGIGAPRREHAVIAAQRR